jgi:hypothetical protein
VGKINLITSVANSYLKSLQDPGGIGRTVEIEFTGDAASL